MKTDEEKRVAEAAAAGIRAVSEVLNKHARHPDHPDVLDALQAFRILAWLAARVISGAEPEHRGNAANVFANHLTSAFDAQGIDAAVAVLLGALPKESKH